MRVRSFMRILLERGARNVGLRSLFREAANRISGGYILCYHTGTAKMLERHIDFLHPDELVPLTELIDRSRAGRSTSGLFAITVDDGERDAVHAFADVCVRRKWPITFYLLTSYIDSGVTTFHRFRNTRLNLPLTKITVNGITLDMSTEPKRKDVELWLRKEFSTSNDAQFQPFFRRLVDELVGRRLLSRETIEHTPPPVEWGAVERLAQNELISFESHGVLHQPVGALSDAELTIELGESKRCIEQHTGRPVRHFCYPYGSARAIGRVNTKLVSDYYSSAVTLLPGRLRGADPFMLPRIGISARRPETVFIRTLFAGS